LSVKVHHAAWKARSPRDLGAGWDFDDVRDHYLADLFKVDPLKLRYADHERYLAMSRIASAEVMAATFSEWRRHRSVCGGALIWFLRDLWPGAGWGIIGSDSVPKAPYYYLRRALQPVSVWLSDEGNNGVSVHVANELEGPWDAQLELALYRNGASLIARHERALRFDVRQSQSLTAADWFDGFRDLSNAYRFGPPSHDLIVATLQSERIGTAVQSVYFPLGLPAHATADVGLTASATARGDGGYQLAVASRAFAFAVVVETDGFRADDQYFHIAPGEQRQVTLRPIPGAKCRTLRGQVSALNAHAAATIALSG
jgi:beta-mannosidase